MLCYAMLGEVNRNAVQHDRPVEKKTAKCVKLKVKDDHLHFTHYLDALCSFQMFVCTKSAHNVHIVHQWKVGLTAFDMNRWLSEDTIHTHSHGHKDTVEDPRTLINDSYMTCSVESVIKRLRTV